MARGRCNRWFGIRLVPEEEKALLDAARALGRSESWSYAAGWQAGAAKQREHDLGELKSFKRTYRPDATAVLGAEFWTTRALGVAIQHIATLPLTAPPPAAEETKPADTCAYRDCKKGRLHGLTMCRRHQPYPAGTR